MKILISLHQVLLCMEFFILRHGKAGKSSGGPDDAARALTRKGEKELKRIAQWMKAQEFELRHHRDKPPPARPGDGNGYCYCARTGRQARHLGRTCSRWGSRHGMLLREPAAKGK